MTREIRVGLATPAAMVTAVLIGFTLTGCSTPAASSTAAPSPSSAGLSSLSPTGSTPPARRIGLDELAQATVTVPRVSELRPHEGYAIEVRPLG